MAHIERNSAADIRQRALSNLQYIRGTMEAAGSLPAVPGRGTIAMGLIALAASALAALPALREHWLTVWAGAAVLAIPAGVWSLMIKLRSKRQTVLHGSARRFLLTLAPALLTAAALTAGLLERGQSDLVPSVWLLGYGSAIAATGSFTARPVALMGASFMAVGGAALVTPPGWAN
ncbi:MAG: hypothetical protein AAGD86_07865, partial [Pseudomonadota bacterium]